MATNASEPVEATLTVNLPVFNPSDVQTWFSQLYAIFNAKKVNLQKLRQAYVVKKLPPEVTNEVVNLLDHMPGEMLYETLKSTIIRRLGESNERILHDLFNSITLDISKPSQLLHKMKALLGNNTMFETVLKNYGPINYIPILLKYWPHLPMI